MKKALLIFMLMLCLLIASLASAETAEDPVLATAYDGAVSVTLSEVQQDYDDMLAYYVYMYQMYGMTADEYDTSFQADLAASVVENTIDVKAVKLWADKDGYEMTEEKKAEIAESAKQQYQEAYDYFKEMLSGYGLSGDELEETVKEELTAGGYTEESFLESAELQAVLDYIEGKATADITVTDEEVRAAYDAELASEKESYAQSIDDYISAYLSGTETLYVPENVRVVKAIYFEAEADGTETTPDESAEIANLTGYAKVVAVKKLIDDGLDFDEAMLTYAEGGSSDEELNLGYPVAEGSTYYSDEFLACTMALKPGEISDVLKTSYGYFIFKYDHDLESKTVDYDTYAATHTETVLEQKKQEAYSKKLDDIIADAGIQLGDVTPLYHIYTGEPMAEYSAYALTKENASLMDKPEGNAVATIQSGAAVEIYGKISVEDAEYAFLSVLGTEKKGYLLTSALEETEKETAEKTENEGKVEAVQVESALPIFTLVMKDGSIIYGELYPELAPEAVGNFADLASQNFYDGLTFHRVIPGFMIQGGDPAGNGTGGPGYNIKGEFSENGVENTLSHSRGVLSMARSQEYDSAGSQFFIMHADYPALDGSYAAFGMTLGGLDTVDVIASAPTDSNDKPRDDMVIRTIYVETHGNTYDFTKITE